MKKYQTDTTVEMNPQQLQQQTQNDPVQLGSEINQWEHAISCYQGEDPLDLWFQFICWLESCMTSDNNIEAKFRKSVEHCLSLYEKYDRYKQDLRMVKLWIKYIDFQPNPLNLYKILYQQGIGTNCAAFYIGWAHYYNSANAFKQAESIYNLGVQLKAEPLAELEAAQKSFRFSVAQRMLYDDSSSKKRTISSLAEQRQQITSLSPHQQNKRARTDDPQQQQQQEVHQYSTNQSHYNSQNLPNNGHQVEEVQYAASQEYQNYAGPSSSEVLNDPGYAISSSLNYVYDVTNDGNTYVEEPPQPAQPVQPAVVYTFECGIQLPPNFVKFARNSNDTWTAPLCQEEPYDPNRRVFYPKQSVYPGDGKEFSLEELRARRWIAAQEEKRIQENLRIHREQEAIRLQHEQEALRIRQEQERLRQVKEAARLRLEQEKIQLQRDEEERRNRELYHQQQLQQQQQQQQQQQPYHPYYHQANQSPGNPYHQQPAANPIYYQQPSYENSPQYHYQQQQHNDHQYQQQYHQQQMYNNSPQNYQNSPQSYTNSPSYHPQQSVIVNTKQYEQPQYPAKSQYYVGQPQPSQYQQQSHYVENVNYVEQQQPQQQQQIPKYENQDTEYQDIEYLIDHQSEIEPGMLKQAIPEAKAQEDESESGDDEDEEEADEMTAPVVNSYMLDDLEEQIEASTISFSSTTSNGKSRNKKITIKFRKEKTTQSVYLNSESNSSCSMPPAMLAVPKMLPSSSTSSSASSAVKRKQPNKKYQVSNFDNENTQFMTSSNNSCSSTATKTDAEFNSSFGNITFKNGCVTPARKGFSKNSTPVSSYKFLKKPGSNISMQNDDSICSYSGDQNSFFQTENDDDLRKRRMDKAVAIIEEHMQKRDIDPFSSELCRSFLTRENFPSRENKTDYRIVSTNLSRLSKNQVVTLAGCTYQIEKEVGRGSYGAVYRGNNTADGSVVALKYQKPPNSWELYICTEVKNRLKNSDILSGFMSISSAVIAPNASVLISEFSQFGSLLDINNRIRQGTTKVMHESLVMHFSSQILEIVYHLHSCNIIHADIKPDNFLLMTLPSADSHIPSLRLIDFGCAIDMKLFKKDTEFRKSIQTDGFTCIEMQEGRPWSFQTDLFCVAGTIHVMLFGEYMQVNKKFGVWDIKQKFPRYLKKQIWTEVFSKLLNIKDNKHLPDLRQMQALINSELNENELVNQIRSVSSCMRKR